MIHRTIPGIRKPRSGSTLLSATMGILVASIGMYILGRMLLNYGRMERGITSNIDLGEVAQLFTMLTETPEMCSKTGLIGLNISPLLAIPPREVPFRLTYPNSGGVSIPALEAGMLMRATRRIASLKLTSLNPVSTSGTGSRYLATARLSTEIVGKAMTMRNPDQVYHLSITTNAADEITSCSRGTSSNDSPSAPFVGVQCPTGTRLQGVDPNGVPNCQPAFNIMGGYFMVSSSQFHNTVLSNPTGATSTTYTHDGTTQTLYFGNCGTNIYTGKCSCPVNYSPIVLMQQTFMCDTANAFGSVYCGYHYPVDTDPLGTGRWNNGWLVHALTVLCTNGAWN